MKTFYGIMKLLAALALVAGVVVVVVKYGDKIVAWFKKLLNLDCFCDNDCCCCDEDCCDEDFCPEEAAEEAPIQAEENDFEG